MNLTLQNKLQPNLPKPTDTEVAEQVDTAAEEYGIQLTGVEATRYTKLKRELGWWLTLDSLTANSASLTENKAQQMKDLVHTLTGKDLSAEEAAEQLRTVSALVSKREKERIATEIRSIIASMHNDGDL